MNDRDERTDYGADVLFANVRGNSIPELKAAALDEGIALHGEDAVLRVEAVEHVTNIRADPENGRFMARVRVRCLNLPDEDRP